MGALRARGRRRRTRAEAPSGGCKTSRGTSVRRCITRIVTSSIAEVVRRATTARRCGVFRRGERVVSGRDDGRRDGCLRSDDDGGGDRETRAEIAASGVRVRGEEE